MAAAAKTDCRAPCQAKGFALRVHDFEVAFHADVAVVIDDDFCRGHSVSGQHNETVVKNHNRTIAKARILFMVMQFKKLALRHGDFS
jgi:hypothetical protein